MVAAQERLHAQGWVEPAPTIEGLLADSTALARREETPVFYVRDAEGPSATIEATTEAAVLRDLGDTVERLKDYFVKADVHPDMSNTWIGHHPSAALGALQKMPNLRFIGVPEIEVATRTFAEQWAQQLDAGKDLYLGVMPYKSSPYIATLVMQQLEKIYPGHDLYDRVALVDTIVGLELSSADARGIRKHGLTYIDDWDSSGTQLRSVVNRLVTPYADSPLAPDQLSISLVCGSDEVLDQGVRGIHGIPGVRVQSYFRRPFVDVNKDSSEPSLTGTLGTVDYGFHFLWQGILSHAKFAAVPPPQLYNMARPYKIERYTDLIAAAAPEAIAPFLERATRFAEGLAKLRQANTNTLYA